MGQTTVLRQLVKVQKTNGVSITEILHPLTNNADPESLRLSQQDIIDLVTLGDLTEIQDNGVGSTVGSKIDFDLDNASKVYSAFSVDSTQENPTVALLAAIDAYGSDLTISRDDFELESDIAKDSIKVLKLNEATDVEINTAYTRASTLVGIVTLELLALELQVTFNDTTTDNALAILIKAAIDDL